MPGKQDPEYFPLNLNVNLWNHLEEENMAAAVVSECIRSRSGSNTTRRTRNVSLNVTQDSEEEDGDVSSVLSASDLDDEDMVDTLVLSIREKLRMDGLNSALWKSTGGGLGVTNDSTSIPSTPFDDEDSSSCHNRRRRRRPHPYRLGLAGNGGKGPGWWGGSRLGRSNPDTPSRRTDDPYQLLQELIDSGSLIKEAVRRLSSTTKKLGVVNTPSGPATCPSGLRIGGTPGGPTLLLGRSPPTNGRFMDFINEDNENKHPLSAQ